MFMISRAKLRRMALATAAVLGLFGIVLILLVKSDPFFYCGYCQHKYSERWMRGNVYPCSYWTYITTPNSSDISLYFNTPAP
jgi:hypothetical protein